MASSGGNTRADFSLGSSGIALESMAADTVVEISGPMRELFPLGQVGYEVRSTEFNMNMPILPSEDTQPFALKLAIEGLTTAEEVWSLFDPTQRLSRDPVDLVIDMEGQAVVTSDVFDDDTRMPFQNSQVTLNALRLAVAGAVLTGSGSVIDKSTPGNPAGIGTLSTRLTGANTLLDTLVDMGLLPNEQAMAARSEGAGDTEITVIIEGAQRTFTMSKGHSVLEAAVSNGQDAPFSCKAGVCSTCMGKLIEGEVEMLTNHALEDYEVERGYILTCQSYPLTDKIVVDYDTH